MDKEWVEKQQKNPISNKNLWLIIKRLNREVNLELCWVKKHDKNENNKITDKLCTFTIDEC